MKPQLDFDTVLEIIKMIENRKENAIQEYIKKGIDKDLAQRLPTVNVLRELEYYLQEYIEGLVTQAENNLNAGE